MWGHKTQIFVPENIGLISRKSQSYVCCEAAGVLDVMFAGKHIICLCQMGLFYKKGAMQAKQTEDFYIL